jgi:hypothetical protein
MSDKMIIDSYQQSREKKQLIKQNQTKHKQDFMNIYKYYPMCRYMSFDYVNAINKKY